MANIQHLLNALRSIKYFITDEPSHEEQKHITCEFKNDTVILCAGQRTRAVRYVLYNPVATGANQDGVHTLHREDIDSVINALTGSKSTHHFVENLKDGIRCFNVEWRSVDSKPIDHVKMFRNKSKILQAVTKADLTRLNKAARALELLQQAAKERPERIRIIMNEAGMQVSQSANSETTLHLRLNHTYSSVKLDVTLLTEDVKILTKIFLPGKGLDVLNKPSSTSAMFRSSFDDKTYCEVLISDHITL